MDTARNWLAENQESVKNELNQLLFKETWDKYAKIKMTSKGARRTLAKLFLNNLNFCIKQV